MKRTLKILLKIGIGITVVVFLLSTLLIKKHLDGQPEITNATYSEFAFESNKPIFYSIDNNLYFHQKGAIKLNDSPILKLKIEEVYVSPNGNSAVIYSENKITLIDKEGNIITSIEDCTDLTPTEEDRKSGRFLGNNIQWDRDSKFFLIAQDRIWVKNRSKKNRTSIYKVSTHSGQLELFLNLKDEYRGDFYLSKDNQYLYYKFATEEGSLAFKKISAQSGKILSEHHKQNGRKLDNVTNDSIFINFRKYKYAFQGNSHDLKKIIVVASGELFLDDSKSTIKLLEGKNGVRVLKGISYDYLEDGYFLPGNRFFIADINAKNLKETIVIDTEIIKIMKTGKKINFYFNVNNIDCQEFEFRYEIVPKVRFATSVENEINRKIRN